jgi:hypothetical protein
MTVPVLPVQRYSEAMEQDASQESMTELLAHAGIVVTDEGRARARRRLAEANARRDPAKLEALRRQLGLQPRSA